MRFWTSLNQFLGFFLPTFGKSCSFGLSYVSFVNVYQCGRVLLSLFVVRVGCGI